MLSSHSAPAGPSRQPNAVLLTGELRFKDPRHVERFKAECRGAEVFVVTYSEYEPLALELLGPGARQRLCLLNRSSLRRAYHSVYQWRHLDTALKLWGQRLGSAPLVLRHRTDSTIALGTRGSGALAPPPVTWAQLRVPADMTGSQHVVFASTDQSFYASGATFARIFSDFYAETMRTYSARLPTPDEAIEYGGVVNTTNTVLSGCVLSPPRRFRSHHADTVAWAAWDTRTASLRDASKENETTGFKSHELFYSERAFAYHIVVRHHAKCMRLCLGVDNCSTAPASVAPREYKLLVRPFMETTDMAHYPLFGRT